MKIKRISVLFLSCLLIVISSFGSYAAVHSSSNAVMALSLDDDSGIALYSSVGTATNTVNWDGARVLIGVRDTVLDIQNNVLLNVTDFSSTGMSFSYSLDGTAWNDPKYIIDKITFVLYKDSLPNVGSYLFSWDVASQFSYSIYSPNIWTYKDNTNASRQTKTIPITDYEASSGDFAVLGMGLQLTNITSFQPNFWISQSDRVRNIDLSCRIGFVRSSGDYSSTAGSDTSAQDYQSEISSSISDIGSSLESVDENLQYISSSQNLIIQGIDNLILHISDQLYALWDQMYNLMHVPTMDKLDEILSALRAIANNSDIYAVVEEIDSSSKEQTSQIVQNANENTSKVEQAVEKHGNFIIEGLKGLFIPSDEYFKGYFDDLYTFFSDRFGFLSFPIDLLQRLADLFLNSDDIDCVLTLPSFEISGEQLLIEQSFNLTEFLESNFSMLLSAIRIVGDCIIIGAFVNLCSNKWDEVMKN